MQKTTNYNLNQWEPTDKLCRADFNSDNADIKAVADTAAGKASAEEAFAGRVKIMCRGASRCARGKHR